MVEEKQVVCGFCQGACDVIVTLEDGVLTKVRANGESPRGRLCPRGALAPRIMYGEDRIKHPLIRTGERGAGEFRRASWDEALEHAASLIKQVVSNYTPRAMASYFGRGVLFNPVFGMSIGEEAFLANLGSPNDSNCASICNTATSTISPGLILGVPTMKQVQDIPHSDLIISWGKNSATDDGPRIALKQIKEAQARGAKLVVIDPRQSGLGEIADWWIPIIPGTDGALALALCKLIIDAGNYDHKFVEKWVLGFDEFCDYLSTLSLEDLCATCGITVADVQRLAELFCSTTAVSLVSYTGLEYALSAVQTIRCQYVLWAITGKLDVEGGIYLDAWGLPTAHMRVPDPDNMALGAKETPLYYGFLGSSCFSRFPRAVIEDDPYPVRGLILAGGAPSISFPATERWREAYRKLECLIVVDRYPTDEMKYADVVLPATNLYESVRTKATPEGPLLVDPVIAPVGESVDEVLIFGRLAHKLGFERAYPTNDAELREWLVAKQRPYVTPLRVPPARPREYKKWESGKLRADGKPGFPTPSGKFEICSTILREYGYTPYPAFQDMRALPEFSDKDTWPLTMTSGARDNKRMGALGANLEEIGRGINPKPFVDIHAEDAADLDIKQGDKIVVETPFGQAEFYAQLGGIAKGAIHVPHGGGSSYMPEDWCNGGANLITSLDYYDPISGFVMLKSIPCRVRKLESKTGSVS